jgi:ribosomal protein S18 acetylase RimI-like enzyme
MDHSKIACRPLQVSDAHDIVEICYRTGYYGEDLTETDRFNDKVLFGMIAARYYVRYEPENCFVAANRSTGRVVGYIIGSLNTLNQEKDFSRFMTWRIVLRALSITIWRHPESFRRLLHFNRYMRNRPSLHTIYEGYPAHLHINVLAEYQKQKIGTILLKLFERHVKEADVGGIHLETSERNLKAIPFYEKHGYAIVAEEPPGLWPDDPDVRGLVFAKNL